MPDEPVTVYQLTDDDVVTFNDAVRAEFSARFRSSISDEQRTILDSGRLDFADYDSAARRMIECAIAKGHTVHASISNADGFRQRVYDVASRGRADPDDIHEFDDCYTHHFVVVDIVWQLGHAELRDKVDAERWRKLLECLAKYSDEDFPQDLHLLSGEERSAVIARAQAIGAESGVDCIEVAGI